MEPLTQIILAAISSGTLATIITALLGRRAAARKAHMESEAQESANEQVRLDTYQKIVSNLEERIMTALQRNRELESELLDIQTEVRRLRIENENLKNENEMLRRENDKLKVIKQ